MADAVSPPRKQMSAWTTSLALHGLLALVFASIVFRSILDQPGQQVFATIASTSQEASVTTSVAVSLGASSAEAAGSSLAVSEAAAQSSFAPSVPRRIKVGDNDATPVQTSFPTDGMESVIVGAIRTADDAPTGELTSSVETDLDGVAESLGNEIRKHSMFKDLLVIWLVDRSISMQRQHKLLADQLLPFFETFDPATESGHAVVHAMVGFGATTSEINRPAKGGERIVGALRNRIEVDPTGQENVFSAVMNCVQEYKVNTRRYSKFNMFCVILTDESGDDIEGMPPVAKLCRDAGCVVSIVGPSASFGASGGLHYYENTKYNLNYHLPVQRGPDCPDQHRILVRQFSTRYDVEPNGQVDAGPGTPNAWEGGPHAIGMASGYPCYDLAMLSAATGGQYIVFDRPDDRPPFDFATLKRYQHQDESQLNETSQLVRNEVLKSVRLTNRMQADLSPPMVYGDENVYGPAGRALGTRMVRAAVPTYRIVPKALEQIRNEHVAAVAEVDWDQCHPRWRAAHQLLIADLLRLEHNMTSYVVALAKVDELPKDTNLLRVYSAPIPRGSSDSETEQLSIAALDAYVRCAEQHAGSPWEKIALLNRDLLHEVSTLAFDTTPVFSNAVSTGSPAPIPGPPRL